MSFKDGDFLEIEYSAWRAVDNKLLYTTDKKKAEEEGIFDEHNSYDSALVILGQNTVVKGLDRELKSMSIGETKKFTLKPEEAFGERNENLVKVMSISDFRTRNINPVPGMRLDIDGVPTTIKSVNSGRVVVDQNHPEAGLDITYEVKVVRLIESDKDKISMLGKTYGVKPSEVSIKEKEVELYFDADVKKNVEYFVGRASLVAAVFNYINNISKISIKEEYINPQEQKKQNVKNTENNENTKVVEKK